MEKQIINTTSAPAPIGPYNQAILAGDMLFISGQICIDPPTGALKNQDIQQETHQVMHNLRSILTAADMTFHNVVKTTIFITDMHRFRRSMKFMENILTAMAAFLLEKPYKCQHCQNL